MKNKVIIFLIFSFILGNSSLAAVVPNDFYYSNQWYLSKIRADKAWEKISKSPDVVIAVIDSGVQIDHPDLAANIWTNEKEIASDGLDNDNNGFIDDKYGWDFVNNVPDPNPKFNESWTESGVSHGTLVSGIIAAVGNNNIGITGLSWEAKIMALKAFNGRGEGKISDIVRAIDYAINNNANIINLSFMNLEYSDTLQEAIARAHRAGIIIVAAAGNEQGGAGAYDTKDNPVYPACYDGKLSGENMVIGVAATDALDQKTSFSAYGNNCIDLSAPGISFFGAITKGGNINDPNLLYDGYWSGTSMAAPLVSGALALIIQVNPELSRHEVVSILFASCDDVSKLNPDFPNQLGNGRLNVDRAVEMAKQKLYSRLGTLLILPAKRDELDSKGKKKDITLRSANGLINSVIKDEIFKGFDMIKAADINDDGEDEFILGAAPGFAPVIRIISRDGRLKNEFLAYDKRMLSGVNLSLGDFDDDGILEIVTVAKTKGDGYIKIFDLNGNLKQEIAAYSRNIKSEVILATGNIDGRGGDEIILSFGPGARSDVRIFSGRGKLIAAFYAFEKKYLGGVEIEVANLDGLKNGKKDEIIIIPRLGREMEVRVFDHHGKILNNFLAFNRNYQGSASLSAGDLNNDGIAEIIVAAKSGSKIAPHVRVFSKEGIVMESFYAWEESFTAGVIPVALKIKN